jgi:hypothetical protein
VASGIYLYRIVSGSGYTDTKRMTLLKQVVGVGCHADGLTGTGSRDRHPPMVVLEFETYTELLTNRHGKTP